MIINSILGLFSNDLAIDLGTANTLVYVEGKGVVADEPSVVAVRQDSKGKKTTLAVGKEAYEMVGRTPGSIEVVRPLRDGVIADFEIAQRMIEYFIKKSHNNRGNFLGLRPRVVISVPIGITEVEQRAVQESAEAAGAREVFLVEETMSAALGTGIAVTEPEGNMVVDIGGGTTGVAVISLSEIVISSCIKVGGDKLNESIMQYMKQNHNILIGERTAENIKKKVSTLNLKENGDGAVNSYQVKGRDIRSGVPATVEVTSYEVREAMSESIKMIVNSIKQTLEKTPPELAGDILDSGVILAGGGALIGGLCDIIEKEIGIPSSIAEDPLRCVVLGSGYALGSIDLLKGVSIN